MYLNEKMVLNCAAYLFKGYSLESEIRDQNKEESTKSVKVGLTFLEKLISFGADVESKHSQVAENKSARRFTVGGLHMSLVDELHRRNMLAAVDPDELSHDLADAPSYIEMPATLRPVDFYSLIDTLRITSPIVAEILKSIVKPWHEKRLELREPNNYLANQSSMPPSQTVAVHSNKGAGKGGSSTPIKAKASDNFLLVLQDIDKYVTALESVLQKLEDDYRRSKQIEMVMWSVGKRPRPYGVVDIDLVDYEPEELRAKLSGGTFRVVGKVTSVLEEGESINLLQKSAIYSALSLANRVFEALSQTKNLAQYRNGLATIRTQVEAFGLLEVPGPAVRIAAMSVCM